MAIHGIATTHAWSCINFTGLQRCQTIWVTTKYEEKNRFHTDRRRSLRSFENKFISASRTVLTFGPPQALHFDIRKKRASQTLSEMTSGVLCIYIEKRLAPSIYFVCISGDVSFRFRIHHAERIWHKHE